MSTSKLNVAVLSVIFLAACASSQAARPGPSPSPSPESSPSPDASPSPDPSPSPTAISPLTPPAAPQAGSLPGQGLPISGELPYPLLIQMENTSDSRPQAGLGAASVVFEYITEGGITRFSLLFHRVPGVVGPVRSARPVAVYLFQRFGALLMASGGTTWTYQKIHDTGIYAVINDFDGGRHFFRWSGRVMPHNLYTSQSQMLSLANGHNRPPRADDVLRSNDWAGTEAAASINVPDLRTSFSYSGGSYGVVSDGAVENDVIFGAVRPKSVAILHVPQWVTDHTDPKGGHLRDFDLNAGGAAELYANGTVIRGRWSTNGPTGVIQLSDASGKPVGMPPGMLWMALAN
jgi:hypothetical protein